MKLKISSRNLFWYTYILLIALPWHQSNALIGYLSITGMVSIFHVLMLMIGLMTLLKNKNNKKAKVFILFFFVTLITGVLVGIKNHGSVNNALGDGGMYLLGLLLYICASSNYTKEKSLDSFLYLTYKCVFFCCMFSALMWLTKDFSFWGLQSFNGGRYFGGFLSLITISIPYSIYNFLYVKKIKLVEVVINFFVCMMCAIISQSRTNIITVVLGTIIAVYLGKRKITGKDLTKIVGISILAIAVLYVFINSNFDVVERLLSTDVTNRSETVFARFYIYNYYGEQIIHNPIGYGFGSLMYFLTPQLMFMDGTATYTVDAALMAAGYKGGWMLLGLYSVAILMVFYMLFKIYKHNKDNEHLLLFFWFGLFLVQTCFLTGQIIHTYAPLTFFWTVVGLLNRPHKKYEGV